MKHQPHKSSIFDLDANITALLIYLIPFLISIISESLSSIAWIVPLIAFIMESKSDFVVFHAANSLAFYVVEAILYVISTILGVGTTVAALFASIPLVGIFGAGFAGILLLILGIFIAIVEVYLFIGNIISLVKAYSYEEVKIPVIIYITKLIQSLKR